MRARREVPTVVVPVFSISDFFQNLLQTVQALLARNQYASSPAQVDRLIEQERKRSTSTYLYIFIHPC